MPSKENLIGWYHLQGTIANRIKPGNCSCKTKGSTVINCVYKVICRNSLLV